MREVMPEAWVELVLGEMVRDVVWDYDSQEDSRDGSYDPNWE